MICSSVNRVFRIVRSPSQGERIPLPRGLVYRGQVSGDASGCSNLGVMYFSGDGVLQDKSKALALFSKACDLKDEHGCENYAVLKNQGVR